MQHLRSMMIVSLVAAASVRADVLAGWTFETSAPGLTLDNSSIGPVGIAEMGVYAQTSTFSGVHASPSTDWSTPVGNGSPESFSSNSWSAGDYWQLRTSTLGFQNITSSTHATRSSTGPERFRLAFSIDGTNYTTLIAEVVVGAEIWSLEQINEASVFPPVGLPASASNQESLFFRLIALEAGITTAGTSRFDNTFVEGVPIPAPSAGLAVACAAALGCRRRR